MNQNKLNVITKSRTNHFNWRGQFTPDFVDYLLDEFASDGCVIADPFAGSGTVICESMGRGLNCVGFEINPAAYYMTNFYRIALLPISSREHLIDDVKNVLNSTLSQFDADAPVFTLSQSYRESYKNLLFFAKNINKKHDDLIRTFLLNLIFLSEKDKKLSLQCSVWKNFNYLSSLAISFPYTPNSNIKLHLSDSRMIGDEYNNVIDIIITSPPYINVFNYHQNYRGIIECLSEYNILKVAESEFGSNRKNRSNRFKTVIQYTLDMGKAILAFSDCLKINGKLILVVGRESKVCGTAFYNSKIIIDIISRISTLKLISTYERSFKNKFGAVIIEDILIVDKISCNSNTLSSFDFRAIANNHLKEAFEYAALDAKEFIIQAINDNNIQESPIIK